MADSIFIQVRFTLTQKDQTLNDALFYDQATYNALTPQQLQADKQARFDAWQKAINTPPPVVSSAVQLVSVTQALADAQQLVTDLTAQKTALQASVIKGGIV